MDTPRGIAHGSGPQSKWRAAALADEGVVS